MSKPQTARPQLESLMNLLGSKDGVIRQRSRESLVAIGKTAVPGLIEAMRNSKRVQVRWEAAKALVALGDSSSIQPFVTAKGWFAARPSGTENIYKIYAESFQGADHLHRILEEAQSMVSEALAAAPQSPGSHSIKSKGNA